MLGLLRVIPSAESKRPPRAVALRKIPSVSFVEGLVGGEAQLIESFDTILNNGEAVPCMAICARDSQQPVNTWANLLHLQAMIRKDGFSGTNPETKFLIRGTVVILCGDEAFMLGLE